MTEQRRVIHRIIMESPEHMTAAQIFGKALGIMPNIAQGTVYRNLNLMCEAGEIRHIPMPDGADRYDRNVIPHGHMVCSRCGCISDVWVDGIVEKIEQDAGIRVQAYELSVCGICGGCLAEMGECPH